MLTNPGGPGGSGLIMPVLAYYVPLAADGSAPASTYDWIGFDPRGVGESVPALSCDPSYGDPVRPPYDPTTPRIERAWLDLIFNDAAMTRILLRDAVLSRRPRAGL